MKVLSCVHKLFLAIWTKIVIGNMCYNIAVGMGEYKDGTYHYRDDKFDIKVHDPHSDKRKDIKIILLGDINKVVFHDYHNSLFDFRRGQWIDHLMELNLKARKHISARNKKWDDERKSHFRPIDDSSLFND